MNFRSVKAFFLVTKRIFTSHRLALPLFTTLLLSGALYRIRIYLGLLQAENKPFAFDAKQASLCNTLQYLSYELLFALVVATVIFMLEICILKVTKNFFNKLLYFFLLVLCLILLLLINLAYGAHYRLILEMNNGLDLSILSEALQGLNFRDFIGMIQQSDLFFLLLPLVAFGFFYLIPFRWQMLTDGALAITAIILLLFSYNQPLLARELRLNPIYYALSDIFNHHQQEARLANTSLERIQNQLQSIQLIDPLFHNNSQQENFSNFKAIPTKWNIVFIILESTGTEYIYDTSLGNELPMPFLKKLASQSLVLENHYSTANSSPRAVFSLFSGTYETPTVSFFSLKRDIKIPALTIFFPEHRQQFLVTPCSTEWYFPKHYLEANGLKEIYGYHKVPVNPKSPAPQEGRNENDTANFFIHKLENALEPFLAVYISFAPHYPYFDYGEPYRILPNLKNSLHRYYNALRLQDTILEKIYLSLERSGKLARTILILVGDHGEAFGQHPNNRIHSRYSYNENLRTPALFYQPKLFPPAVIREPTSHVDILPTLLSAIGKPYNPQLFQGENLLNNPLKRRYIFAYGNENTLSIISRQNIKMQLLLQENSCRVFNLLTDPREKNPIACTSYPEMYQAGMAFIRFQPEIMKNYNQQYSLTGSFYGKRHPSPTTF